MFLTKVAIGENGLMGNSGRNIQVSQQPFLAIATIEQDAEPVMIPADAFREWIRRYDQWRDFFRTPVVALVYRDGNCGYSNFSTDGHSLRSSGIGAWQTSEPLSVTDQEIAAELGSSREVINRLLEDMANRGMVRVLRGSIEVLDVDLPLNQPAW